MNNFNEEKLPEGWEVKSLADIGNIFSGNSINAKLKEEKYTNKEGTPYVATKDISYNSVINYDNGINIPFDDVNKFRLAKSETILICAEGGSAGRKVGILNQDVYFVNKLFALETISEVNSKFCFYWYLSKEFKSNFKDKLKGLIGGVSKTDFKNLLIPIPPFSEQKRIVDKIDGLFVKIDKAISLTEESLKQAENLLPSVLKEIFEKGKADGWDEKKWDEVLEIKNGKSQKEFLVDEGGYPIYGSGGLMNGRVSKFLCPKNTTIVGRKGTIDKPKYIEEDFWNVDTAFGLCSKTGLNPRFLYYFCLTFNFRSLNKSTTLPSLTKRDLLQIKMPITTSENQMKVVSIAGDILLKSQKTQSKLEQQLAYLKQLKSSILSKAFKGEL